MACSRRTATIVSALLALALLLPAAAALSLDIDAPATAAEGEALSLSVTADRPATLTIHEGPVLRSANGTYDAQLGYDSAGLRTYTFRANTSNESAEENRTVEVLDTPLAITVHEPSDDAYSAPVPISLETSIPADECRYGAAPLTQDSPTAYTGSAALGDGVHTLSLTCQRNAEVATAQRTVLVDTRAPTLSLAPSGATSSPVTLKATTDEVATCRYGQSLAAYDALPEEMAVQGGLLSTASLELAPGTYTYYVACRDVHGNTAAAASTTFDVRVAPSARIELEGTDPRRAGTYRVTVETNQPLVEPPVVKLTYQGGATTTLGLTEETSTSWEGYVIIGDEGERVATFSFEGRNADGVAGTRIAEGALFLVDTTPPGAIESFRLENTSGRIALHWYYPDEDAKAFNVYKSTEKGVDYTDKTTRAVGDSWSDYAVNESVLYYYRVAAVDEAGNVGPLGPEAYASAAAAQNAEEQVSQSLDPVLQVTLDVRLRDLQRLILDAERGNEDLLATTDAASSKLVEALGLAGEASAALRELRAAEQRLEALRNLALDRAAFDKRLTDEWLKVERASGSRPSGVRVTSSTSYDELPDQAAIRAAANLVFTAKGGDEEEYLAAARSLNERVTAYVALTSGAVTYADGREDEVTLVEKRLVAQEQEQNVLALETVTDAAPFDEVRFLAPAPVTLKAPTVQYTLPTLTDTTLRYVVPGTVTAAQLRTRSLALLPKPRQEIDAAPAEDHGLLSGNAVAEESGGSWTIALIVLGLLVIAGLLAYYVRLAREDGDPVIIPRREPARKPSPPGTGGRPAAPPARAPPPASVVDLLVRGHALIDGKHYPDALSFYKRASALYAEEPLPEKVKAAAHEELALLHRKLLLHRALEQAHDAVHAADAAALERLLGAVREHAAAVGDGGTPLVEHAKRQYAYLYRASLGLGREEPL